MAIDAELVPISSIVFSMEFCTCRATDGSPRRLSSVVCRLSSVFRRLSSPHDEPNQPNRSLYPHTPRLVSSSLAVSHQHPHPHPRDFRATAWTSSSGSGLSR